MSITLKAEKREKSGKYIAFDLRKVGKIPAVAYGPALKENINLTISQKELKQLLVSGSRLIDLDVDGTKHLAVIKDVQHATIGSDLLHADFRAVTEKTLLHLSVEITCKGDAAGTILGGIIEQNLHMVALECLPKALPQKIELDISALTIGEVLFVKDLPKIDGVKYVTHADVPVVSCRMKSEEAAAAPAAETAEATPAAGAKAEPAAGGAKAEPAAKPAAKK